MKKDDQFVNTFVNTFNKSDIGSGFTCDSRIFNSGIFKPTNKDTKIVENNIIEAIDNNRYCSKCGNKLLEKDIFCRKCGQKY